jgi:type II restriction enzyme
MPIVTEQWAADCMFCPSCGCVRLSQFAANAPVADFFCASCGEQYELKSRKSPFGRTLANGAYAKKLERLKSDSSPNLLLLQYDPRLRRVVNLTAVPKRFFTHSIIEKRKPLSAHARRAGWIGSNIHLHLVPSIGRIHVIVNGVALNRDEILERWKRTAFIEDAAPSARGWIVDVLACVEKIEKDVFDLSDVYSFEGQLQSLYPSNRNIRPKIRQQLQVLRENNILEFLGKGKYRKLP